MPRGYKRSRSSGNPLAGMYPPLDYHYVAMPRTIASELRYGKTLGRANATQRLQRRADRMVGRGAYSRPTSSMTTNSTIPGGGFDETVPAFGNPEDELGAVRITHKEYITDVYGNASASQFVDKSLPINPGQQGTFPWLSQLACNFEEYEFESLVFTFRSLISNDASSSNGQVGTIIMATNYNAAAPLFSNKSTMMQYAGACSTKVTDDLMHGIECDPDKLSGDPGKYVRSLPVLPGQDLKTYDLGLFQYGISGTPTTFQTQPVGELWVSYNIVLRKPKLVVGLGQAIQRDDFFTKDFHFGRWDQGLLTGQQNSIGCTISSTGTTSTITFPSTVNNGHFIINVVIVGTAMVIPTYTITYSGGVVGVSDIPLANGLSTVGTSAAQAGSTLDTLFDLTHHVQLGQNYGGAPNSITFGSSSTVPGGTTFTSLWICISEYNPMGRPTQPPLFVNTQGVVTST